MPGFITTIRPEQEQNPDVVALSGLNQKEGEKSMLAFAQKKQRNRYQNIFIEEKS